VALIAAVAMLRRRWEAQGGSREFVYDVALWAFPAGIISGRLYFLATTPGEAIEAAETGAQASVALDAREAGLGAEHVQPAGGLIARALAAVDEPHDGERGAHDGVVRPAPVGDVQPPLRAQHAARVGERAVLGAAIEVVQQQRHHHRVGAGVVELEFAGEPSVPGHALGARLALCEPQHLGIAVDRDHLRVGTLGGDGDRQGAGAGPTSTMRPPRGTYAAIRSHSRGRQQRSRIVAAGTVS
jgi:hypothetical protein